MAILGRASSELQTSQGHAPVPYETPMYRIGRKGLNLVDAIDDLDPQELSRSSNMRSTYGGTLEVRPGQTALGTTTGSDRVHSLVRLNDPGAGTFTRLAGSSTTLYRGQSGALTLIDSGYSGDPLIFAAASAPLTGVPFMFIGDRTRNRKVARTGAVSTIGLSAPTVIATVAVAAENTTNLCRFDNMDGTDAATWTMTAGMDTNGAATGAPSAADTGAAVAFTTDPTGAGAGLGYFSTVSVAAARDLSTLQSGLYVATDDDLMNLRFRVDRPDRLEEIRVYLVCSAVMSVGVEPGTDPTLNTDAYFKSFRPNDLTAYLDLRAVPAGQTVAGVGDTIRDQQLREEFKLERQDQEGRADPPTALTQTDLARTSIPSLQAGREVETVTGVVGYPLRRGDFVRIGNATGRDWATLTGLVIVLRTNTNEIITVTCDDWRMTGGGGPDTTEPDAQPYDFRYTNYEPATGVESNPSPVMSTVSFIEALRQPLRVTPWVSGISTLRQRFYRRGGTLNDDWYFDGVNSSDGGVYETYLADTEIAAAGTLETDHYQPVPSTNSSGVAVLAQVVPVYFPVGAYMFALGDPNQPGRLYRSKLEAFDYWPADGYREVCGGSEELMNGCEWAAGGYVFSRTRLYNVLIASDGEWDVEPTACTEGLGARWAMCPTPFGIAFMSPFGIRLTNGGVPERLSDEQLEPLFRGETVRGMLPINFAVPTALRLEYYDDELWFTYEDTGGGRRHLIWNFFSRNWRPYVFTTPAAVVYGESVQGVAASLLLGSNAAGAIYTHDGFSDLGTAIAYSFRTGASDFGDPRVEKLLGEIILDAEIFTTTLTVQALLNDELTSVSAQTVVGTAGFRRYSFEPFGTSPQRARNVAVNISANSSTSARPYFNLLGVSRQLQPEITFNLPTPWEELPGGEGYVWGCFITCDTGGTARTVEVEYTTNNGSVTSAATLTVTATGRRKLPFTWTSVLAQQIRLRPTGTCIEWIRYKIEWLSDPEPPRVLGWDTNWEDFGTLADKWIKGYLIEADTFNAAKTVVLDSVDSDGVQNLAVNSLALTRNGRGIYHHSFAKVRGRLFRLRATDANMGKLFKWQPIFDEEPLALTRWEGQEMPFQGMSGRWHKPLEAFITIRSTGTVTWRLTAYGLAGASLNVSDYTIASTAGAKQKVRVPLNATKGLLFTPLFTAAAGFWLYKEESEVLVEDWESGEARWVPLVPANDDLDLSRAMGNSAIAAATPGGA